MPFGDSVDITYDAVAKSLVRINGPQNYASEFLLRETLHEFRSKIRHTNSGGKNGSLIYDRHSFELTKHIYATASDPEYHQKVYLVIENLPNDDPVKVAQALCDYLIATSNAAIDDLVDWQS